MKNLKRIGNIVTLLAVLFLVQKLFTLGLDLEAFHSKEGIFVLLLTVLIYVISTFFSSFPWKKLISIFETKKLPWKKVSYVYVKSNLLKYIPGNVFQYVGRNQLAVENQLSHANVLIASLLEILCIIASAIIFSLLICGKSTVHFVRQFGWKSIPLFVVLLLVLCCVGLVLWRKYKQKLQEYMRLQLARFKLPCTWGTMLLIIIFYLLIFTLQSIAFYAVLNICAPNSLPIESMQVVMGAYVLSWLIGYITPGSPGGLGVREIVLLGMLSQSAILEDSITFSLIVMRAANIVGDVLAYIFTTIIARVGIHYGGEAR